MKPPKKLIDVIIPFYNAADTLGRALSSIAVQSFADKIEVTIVDDHSSEDEKYRLITLIDRFRSFFPITRVYLPENVGPGNCRQKGIDLTVCPYIVFLDADDLFASHYALEAMYREITDKGYNILLTDFQEESYPENAPISYVVHQKDTTWMFGKMYRRSCLEECGAHFNPDGSYANEDSGFNAYLYLMTDDAKIGHIPYTTYTWAQNRGSITRRNNCVYNYTSGIQGFVDNQLYTLRRVLEVKTTMQDRRKAIHQMVSVLMSVYKTYAECLLSPEHSEHLGHIGECARKFYGEMEEFLKPSIEDSRFIRLCADSTPPHLLLLYNPYEFIRDVGFFNETESGYLRARHRQMEWKQ